MKIILFSFFNSNNIGDLLISQTFSRELSAFAEVIPADYNSSFEIKGKYDYSPYSTLEKGIIKLCSMLNIKYTNSRRRSFLKKYKEVLKEADMVIFGGGNIIMDYTPQSHSCDKFEDYIKTATQCGVPCASLSVGIGPFYSEVQCKAAAKALSNCEIVSFRDKASLDLFISGGGDKSRASISADPVFTLPLNSENQVLCDRIAVNVIAPDWESTENYNKVEEGYRALLERLSSDYPDKKITLFCTEKKDLKMLKSLFNAIDGIHRVDISSAEELLNLYSQSVLVIGVRMHSLIVAYTQRKPVIGLVWQTKVREFFNITQLENSCFQINSLDNATINKIIKIVGEKLNATPNYENSLNSLSTVVRKDIQRIFNYDKS